MLYLYVINLQELATSNYFYIIRLICIWNPLHAACPVKKIDRRRHNIIDLVFWRKFIYNKKWRKATKSNNKTANPRKKTHINKLNEQVHLSRQKRKNNKVEFFLGTKHIWQKYYSIFRTKKPDLTVLMFTQYISYFFWSKCLNVLFWEKQVQCKTIRHCLLIAEVNEYKK